MNSFYPMWVLNLTPDSFSDGGKWQRDSATWTHYLNSCPFEVIIDVGAESTAPGRQPISASEEIQRLENFFFSYLSQVKREVRLSIDTYKPETMRWCLSRIKDFSQVRQLYWNDVSGHYQDEVATLLREQEESLRLRNLSLKYVLCHNRIPSRANVLEHTLYAKKSATCDLDVYQEVKNYFTLALNFFKSQGLEDKVVLDPAFGFSKSREENWILLNKLPELVVFFNKNNFLIGISRKSFLREANKQYQDDRQAERTLSLESFILGSLQEKLKLTNTCNFRQHVIWRTHNTILFRIKDEVHSSY